jgi:hypothetical protein
MNENNIARSLGKGEVVSSILTGSTTEAASDGHFSHPPTNAPVDSLRTEHEHCTSGGAPDVHGVHEAFTAWCQRQTYRLPTNILRDAVFVRLSLQACIENPGRQSFVGFLARDVAKLEHALIAHSSRAVGPMKSMG